MNCPLKSPDGKARLLAFVAGTLDGQEASDFSVHLRGCGDCGDFVQRQCAMWNLLDEWEPEAVSTDFARHLRLRIDEAGPEPWRLRFAHALAGWIPRPALTIPLATLLLLGSFYVDRPVGTSPPLESLPAPMAASASVTPNDAEQLKSALDDLQLLHQLDLTKDEAPDASRTM